MGEGVVSATFLQIGATTSGVISEAPEVRQQSDMASGEPKVWSNGDPMLQLVVTLQTEERRQDIEDDDGRRRIYIKSNMKNAVRDAVKKAGAKQLLVGGKLAVRYVADGEVSQRGFNAPKMYQARYEAPADNFLQDEPSQEPPPPFPGSPEFENRQTVPQSVPQILSQGEHVAIEEDDIPF